MSASLALPVQPAGPFNRIVKLSGLFWTFSYVLLSIRGALFYDDWSRLFDSNRFFAVSVGAVAYAVVLKQLESGRKISLRGSLAWVAGATLLVSVVRLALDESMFDVARPIDAHLLWSLTWSAYFALWVMGSLAFAPAATSVVQPARAAAAAVAATEALEELVAAIVAEADQLSAADRAVLAARILEIGGYATVDGPASDNERARLALRIAARLSAAS